MMKIKLPKFISRWWWLMLLAAIGILMLVAR